MEPLDQFESIVRRVSFFTNEPAEDEGDRHPFVVRDIHSDLPAKVKRLFDDAHYAEATFEAYKFLDKSVAKIAGSRDSGQKLMMTVFSDSSPIKLNSLTTESEKDEQNGYKFLFAGAIAAVRNPRGHEFDFNDTLESCLDHLSLASLLIRKLENSGYTL
ncbi:TIGR02391 family protein [Erythrobacter sanguineus]|uniref:TIGR02391 family protein n=1 Tax=Erythrobacter sanguineus TaxID=198312 RepID=UPI0009353CFA|nr:TIGR02391 family protein [Erythrobacter sanguineus]